MEAEAEWRTEKLKRARRKKKKIMKNSEAGEGGRGNVENRLEWRARSGRWIKESRDTAFGG